MSLARARVVRQSRHPALALAALLLAGGCGSGDDKAAPDPSASPGGSSSPASSAAPTSSAPSTAAAEPRALWPAPPDPLARAVEAGLVPERKETLTFHVHAHLDVFVDGAAVPVPAGIGINTADPGVKTFGEGPEVGYGGIEGCDQPCISPLHTHDPDGILHTESADNKPNTLRQFFVEWGVRFTATCLADRCDGLTAYVDGKRYDGDPTAIELLDAREIAIVVGTPPEHIPDKADFSNA